MKQIKSYLYIVFVLSFVFATSCMKHSDADTYASTQQCLDSATSSTVDTCLAKISGMSGKQADALRCNGAFIKEGFTNASKLVSALNTIQNGVNSSNYATFLGLITFTSQGTSSFASAQANYTLAKTTSTTCASSNSKAGTLISTFAFLANAFYKVGCDPTSVATCDPACNTSNSACMTDGGLTIITNVGSSQDSLLSDLGTVVVNAYLTACDSGAKTDTLCVIINKAVSDAGGTSNTKTVGQKFVAQFH